MSFVRFLRENAPFLLAGTLLSFLSSFGQTFFISIFGGEIRAEFGLSDGEWGWIYTAGTGGSAFVMLFAGGLTDRFRARSLGAVVVLSLALFCVAMSLNSYVLLLPLVIFGLRFFGQGMTSTVSVVAMARWFVATRGRAIAIAALGFSLGEAVLPLTFVWLKHFVDWRTLWLVAAVVCVLSVPLLLRLLRLERQPAGEHDDDASAAGIDNRHWTRRQALGLPIFWLLMPLIMMTPALNTAFWFHQVHFAGVKGWDHISLVAILPLGTLSLVLSTQLFGWALDKWGATRLLPVYLVPFALGLLAHWWAGSVWVSAVGVVLMGISGGGQSTLPAACWAEFFGTRHIGAIKSTAVSMMVLASAVGPGVTGALIDAGVALPDQLLFSSLMVLGLCLAVVLPVRNARARLSVAL